MKSFETDDESNNIFSQHMINLHVLILMIDLYKEISNCHFEFQNRTSI